jgi:hypothetical protein
MVPMARSRDVTLVDVMDVVREAAANEQEFVATVVDLVRSGQVRLSDDAVRATQDLLAMTEVAT